MILISVLGDSGPKDCSGHGWRTTGGGAFVASMVQNMSKRKMLCIGTMYHQRGCDFQIASKCLSGVWGVLRKLGHL